MLRERIECRLWMHWVSIFLSLVGEVEQQDDSEKPQCILKKTPNPTLPFLASFLSAPCFIHLCFPSALSLSPIQAC